MKKEEEDLLRLKEILDRLGFEFFLVQGTLLGAIRDKTLINYDKDFDLGTFEDLGDPDRRAYIIEAFQQEGLKCQMRGPERNSRFFSYWILVGGLKWPAVILPCKRAGNIISMTTSPLRFPVKLFAELRGIDFLGTSFLVPHPPEDWLEFDYGKSWRISAKRAMIVKESDPVELYKPPPVESVYLRCDLNGELIHPLESIGPQLD